MISWYLDIMFDFLKLWNQVLFPISHMSTYQKEVAVPARQTKQYNSYLRIKATPIQLSDSH